MESMSSPRKREPQLDKTSTRKTLTWLKKNYKLTISRRFIFPYDKKKIAQLFQSSSPQTRKSKSQVKCKALKRSTTRQLEKIDQFYTGSRNSNTDPRTALFALPLASISKLNLPTLVTPRSTGRARSRFRSSPNRHHQPNLLSPIAEMDTPPSVKGQDKYHPGFSRPVLPSTALIRSNSQNDDRRKPTETDLISFVTPSPYSEKRSSSSLSSQLPIETVPRKYRTPERRGVFDASESTSKTLNESHPPLIASYDLSGPSNSTGSAVCPGSFKLAPSLCTSSDGHTSSSTPVEYGVALLETICSLSQESPCASRALLLRARTFESSQGPSPTGEGFRIRYGYKNNHAIRRSTSLGRIEDRMNVTPSRIPRRIGSAAVSEGSSIIAVNDENQIAGDSDSVSDNDIIVMGHTCPSKLNNGKGLVINVQTDIHTEYSPAKNELEMGKKVIGPAIGYNDFGPRIDDENSLNIGQMRRTRRAAQFAHDKATNLRARHVYEAAGVRQPSRSPPTPVRSSSLLVNRTRNPQKSVETKKDLANGSTSPAIQPMGVVTKIWASPPRNKDANVSRPRRNLPEILNKQPHGGHSSNRNNEPRTPRASTATQSQFRVKPKISGQAAAPPITAAPLPRRVPTTRIAKFRKEVKRLGQRVSKVIAPPSFSKGQPEPVDKQEPAKTTREKTEWAYASDVAGDQTASGQANAPTTAPHGLTINTNGDGTDPPSTPPSTIGPSGHYTEDSPTDLPPAGPPIDPLVDTLLADVRAHCLHITDIAHNTPDPESSRLMLRIAERIGDGLIAIQTSRIAVLRLTQTINAVSVALATASATTPFH